ncbi:sigma-70 family RNA polymerase sigma factor [Aquimarina sp. MMG016]|uniref:RNA polymerase sigma factor n=1 Tax=Aquimarina sp. MMG016 TaxID=2822690 RepID=UPI001B3A3679|nr:sigma-70 family RNA polymerase sigma factor [Aquimarina sp. MMG016]MBQ4818855.1 sigma-70 family RNA polymerase sigma factor [Aquimarina sp. MMG016]
MNTKKNQQIIDGIITGDRLILKTFYKNNLPYIRKYILKQGGCIQDVEDVFQDSLVLIYQKLLNGSLQIDISIHSFFIGVCKNKWREQLRIQHKVRYNDQLVTQKPDYTQSVIDTLIEKDQTVLYHKHLDNLSEKNRTILQLFFEGKSMREIATVNGYTEGYARKKKFEIKETLLRMIQKNPVYDELAVV